LQKEAPQGRASHAMTQNPIFKPATWVLYMALGGFTFMITLYTFHQRNCDADSGIAQVVFAIVWIPLAFYLCRQSDGTGPLSTAHVRFLMFGVGATSVIAVLYEAVALFRMVPLQVSRWPADCQAIWDRDELCLAHCTDCLTCWQRTESQVTGQRILDASLVCACFILQFGIMAYIVRRRWPGRANNLYKSVFAVEQEIALEPAPPSACEDSSCDDESMHTATA
jgi:hypothetical protein